MSTVTILEQPKAMPLDEIINQIGGLMKHLHNAYNADVDHGHLLLDELERVQNENSFLKLQIQTLTGRVNDVVDLNDKLLSQRVIDEKAVKQLVKDQESVIAKAEEQRQMIGQSVRQEQQAKNKLNDAIITIASYKELGTPGAIRKQRKTYRDRIETLQKAAIQHKVDAKIYRHDVTVAKKETAEIETRLREIDITQIYSENGEQLYLFPKIVQIPSRGMTSKKIVMLYLNGDGRGGLMSLDEDNEITLGKGIIRPKAATKNHSASFLRKWNKAGHVQAEDLRIFGEQV